MSWGGGGGGGGGVAEREAWTTGGAGGVGGLLTISSSTSVQYVSFDANGNVASLANATDGTIAAQYEYGPFGEAVRTTRASGQGKSLPVLNEIRG